MFCSGIVEFSGRIVEFLCQARWFLFGAGVRWFRINARSSGVTMPGGRAGVRSFRARMHECRPTMRSFRVGVRSFRTKAPTVRVNAHWCRANARSCLPGVHSSGLNLSGQGGQH